MRKLCLIFVFFCISILFCFYSIAQDIEFDLVTPPKNEPWGRVSGMVQDPQGFLWMATNGGGLYRYDGHNYISYHRDPTNPNSLAFEWIECLYGSSQDNFLLIGTPAYGLDHYDLVTGNFTHYRYNPNDTTTLGNDTITSIIKDRQGMFWIGTHNGLNQWNPQTGKFRRFNNNPTDSSSLSDSQVRVLYLDREGTVWVGTKSVWPDDGGTKVGGLNRYDPKTGKFIRYMHKPSDPQSLADNQITALFEDSRGTFWVGTAGDGLHTMDREKGTFTRHLYDPKHPQKLSRPPVYNKFSHIVAPFIVFISEDSRGKIWIGTFDNGINVYDPITRQTIYYGSSAQDSRKKLTESAFSTAFTTTDGTLWVASWGDFFAPRGNLYKINPGKDALSYTHMGTRVYNFYQDRNGVVWIATAQGLYKKSSDGTMQQFLIDTKASSLNNVMVDIKEDKAHNLWIATRYNGLYRFNPTTQTFSGYHHQAGNEETLSSDSLYTLALAPDNKLWIGTWNGLNALDITSGTFKHYVPDPSFAVILGGALVFDILIDRNQDIWTCAGWGVNRLDKKTGHFKKYLLVEFSDALNITEDSGGDLWVGDGAGLFSYNKEADVFTPFYDSTGVINRVTTVFNITEDHQKNLWLKTPKKIIKLNVQKKEASVYETRSHEYDYVLFSSYITGTGEILSGDTTGYISFYPDSLLKGVRPPAIALTGFSLSDQPVNFGKSSLLPEPIYQLKELRLKHFQNTFSIAFTSIDFTSNGEDRHMVYMLENYDSKWRKADAAGTAGYYNVPAGKYVFRVKVMNLYGQWAQKEISVVISPPFWRTPWAYGLYGLVVLGLAVMGREIIVRSERVKAAHRLRLLQAEQLHQIDQLKSRFFTNISHEFRTPLTLIFAPLEKLLNQQLDSTQIKKNLRLIDRHARQLLHLINQLMDFSKLESGSLKLSLTHGDINRQSKVLTFSFTSLAQSKGINLAFSSAYQSILGYFDSNVLEKVMHNLLSNAFKFTPPGGSVRVEVTLSKALDEAIKDTASHWSQTIGIHVKDTGSGIPAEEQSRIFERFYQVDGSQIREGEGTGIGLALAKELAELHGGRIELTSEVGKGSEFILYLPLTDCIAQLNLSADRQEMMPDRLMMVKQENEESTSPLQTPTEENEISEGFPLLLIVEDNREVREFIRDNFIDHFRVLEASNGLEGLELGKQHIPDLIISDRMMPKMDGMELCRQFKTHALTSHVPIIMLTAKATQESKIEGLEIGADDYVAKPFSLQELKARVKNLIDQRKKLRERFTKEVKLQPKDIAITSTDELFINKAIAIIERHMSDEDFTVEIMVEEMAMSRVQLHRKLKALTDESTSEFIRTIRLKRAASLLEQGYGSVSEVMYAVGFNSVSYFASNFKQRYGVNPSQYPPR
ncbi:response regulator [Rhodocytophaga rosea]|uniref:histidine kinase n=1 Tax=Rhodocytophaga rosea TaxID=2704465 RepID=A0A6C0GH71_9BACT|nr:two-component regulator propeller domain-containing protein [Rhodocytophaga rosea]QHT67376.1 response regulator [Rhodocytophaga rosea]